MPHFPRFRALALFGRRPPQRVDSIVMPASENLHNIGSPARLVGLIASRRSAIVPLHDGGARMRHSEPDVVIVGAGIAGGALGTVLARGR